MQEATSFRPEVDALRLSVLVPTHGRPERIEALLGALSAQTAPSGSFEVVVVDDGGDPPVQVDVRRFPYALTLLQRRCAGPAAARNAGLAVAAAPLVLILNDDAVPAPDLIERHLEAHGRLAEEGTQAAVLGTFRFTERSLQSPLVQVLDQSDELFTFSGLEENKVLDWTYCWTCNLSLATETLFQVGGFDEERFDRPIGEDVELGLRLQKAGVGVIYDPSCIAHHEHVLTPSGYAARAVELGIYQTRIGDKHGLEALFWGNEEERRALESQAVSYVEEHLPRARAFFQDLEDIEVQYQGQELPKELLTRLAQGLREHTGVHRVAGLHRERTGVDLLKLTDEGAPEGTSVAVVVVSCDAMGRTQACIESLRRHSDARFPQEIFVVDNGSTDGSAEWLREQPDIQLITNDTNEGAPRARNQALMAAGGRHQWVAFLDNDVIVPDDWLERALYHGAADPTVGSVALCANRASKRQVLSFEGTGEPRAIDAFAAEHARKTGRSGEDATLFTSLAVLVRGEVLLDIGGFDETFSPWGFEDDDLALRIRLSGWKNRVAKDSFVYHAPYDGAEKTQRHAGFMEDNWTAFLEKWCPSAAGSELFDYSRVNVPQLGEATDAQLRFPLSKSAPRAASSPVDHGTLTPGKPSPANSSANFSGIDNGGQRANVLILGCGRSGTSMVTGMLAEAGWHVGTNPYPGRAANPKGFFETAEINGINEYLLSTAVPNEAPLGSMQHWLAYAPEPLDLDVDPALRARMDRLAAKGPFAYKDPRFCYTLDAWRPSVNGAKYVCIFREPAASAASIVTEVRKEAYLEGTNVDFHRAVDVWQAMYRRVLDDHSQTGEWLFLHFDQLLTPEGAAKLEAFVGGKVAADFPEPRLKRSASQEPVAPEVAATYRELCERAAMDAPPIPAHPESPTITEVDAPEMTVLVCTYQRRDTLRRCLESFEDQTARGRYEIVVVNDGSDDGTREMLEAWKPKAPMTIVHRANGGLAAARNSGLAVSRGKFVMLVNDDTIAASDLVEQHLLAHAQHGPARAVLGTFEQPREALDNALMRAIEETTMVFCYEGLDPNRLHDWNRFWTCNVSVSLEDVRSVGNFDESFRHYGCEDTDLAYRLHRDCGTRVVYAPAARATHEHILDFDAVRHRSRTVSSAFVRFFKKHPEALAHPFWRGRAQNTLQKHDELLVKTLPIRARAEAMARELSQIDLGVLERAGAEGEDIAAATLVRLKQYMTELNHLWWAEGESEGLRGFGLQGMTELTGPRPQTVLRESAAV